MSRHAAVVMTVLLTLAFAGPLWAQRGGCLDDEPQGSELVVPDPGEPGEPLVVSGRTLDRNGDPLAGVRIRVFHTDHRGYYSEGGMDEANARLCGVLETGEDGRYRIRTILPAPYATGGPRPHIHFAVHPPSGGERRFTLQWTAEQEGGDPAAGERSASVRPLVRGEDGTLYLVYDLFL